MEDEILLTEISCEKCKHCYSAKDDDGRWLMCNNEKTKKYVKKIDYNFGCIFFEPNSG